MCLTSPQRFSAYYLTALQQREIVALDHIRRDSNVAKAVWIKYLYYVEFWNTTTDSSNQPYIFLQRRRFQ